MKFKNLVVNGKKIDTEIPTAWHLVTFRQYHKLAEYGKDLNDAKTISVFTGIELDTIRNAKIKKYEVVISMLSFMKKEINLIIPETVRGYKVPRMLEEEAASRYSDIQEIAGKFVKDDKVGNLKHYPLIVATYVSPSPYNIKEIDKLAEYLWDAPCSEVMAIGNFILMKLNASRNGMLNNFPLEGTLRSKLRQATINWLQRLAFRIRYATWKRSLPSNVRSFLNGQ